MKHILEKTIPAFLFRVEVVDFWMKQPKKQHSIFEVFDFESVFDYGTYEKDKSLVVIIDTVISHEGFGKFASITTACYFNIDDFDKFQLDNKGCRIIPKHSMAEFYSVAYSTSRGLLYSQVRGTFLHNAFLPLADTYSGIKKRKKEHKVEKL